MIDERIRMLCLFCGSDGFELPRADYQPSSGEMIKCAACGRLNDYDSMLKVVKEKAVRRAEEEAAKIVQKAFKQFRK